jgi:hypothetical protein
MGQTQHLEELTHGLVEKQESLAAKDGPAAAKERQSQRNSDRKQRPLSDAQKGEEDAKKRARWDAERDARRQEVNSDIVCLPCAKFDAVSSCRSNLLYVRRSSQVSNSRPTH